MWEKTTARRDETRLPAPLSSLLFAFLRKNSARSPHPDKRSPQTDKRSPPGAGRAPKRGERTGQKSRAVAKKSRAVASWRRAAVPKRKTFGKKRRADGEKRRPGGKNRLADAPGAARPGEKGIGAHCGGARPDKGAGGAAKQGEPPSFPRNRKQGPDLFLAEIITRHCASSANCVFFYAPWLQNQHPHHPCAVFSFISAPYKGRH